MAISSMRQVLVVMQLLLYLMAFFGYVPAEYTADIVFESRRINSSPKPERRSPVSSQSTSSSSKNHRSYRPFKSIFTSTRSLHPSLTTLSTPTTSFRYQPLLFTPSDDIDHSGVPTEYHPRYNLFNVPETTEKQLTSRFPTESSSVIQSSVSSTQQFTARHPITFHSLLSTSLRPPYRSIQFPNSMESGKIHLKDYIKDVLKMEQTNETIDNIVTTSFNLDTPDPMYVFLLPDDTKNRTLVLHRSSFDKAVWPNISPIQRHVIRSNISKLYNLIETIEKIRPQKFKPVPVIRLVKKRPKGQQGQRPKAPDADLEEAESILVVEENVRTERNFLRYMEFLNEHPDYSDETRDANRLSVSSEEHFDLMDHFHGPTTASSHWRSTRPQTGSSSQVEYGFMAGHTTPSSVEDDSSSIGWEELGLDGWLGGIKAPGKSFSKTSFSNAPSTYWYPKPTESNHYTSVHTHSFDEPFLKPSSPTYDFKTSTKKGHHMHKTPRPKQPDAWDVPGRKIPPELNELLNLEYYQSSQLNLSNTDEDRIMVMPKWPVTSSRSAHLDEDVFIGRANNPFGHSTKWKLSNSTSTSDGRTKRGALLLYSMVKCSTGCDPLVYKGYGCYCGFLGSGRALDGIDRCCKKHDFCYEKANCPMFLEYFVPYLWKCYRGRPLCAIDHGEWGGPGSCASRLCECDQSLSKCLRRFYCPRKRPVCTSSPFRLLQNVIMM